MKRGTFKKLTYEENTTTDGKGWIKYQKLNALEVVNLSLVVAILFNSVVKKYKNGLLSVYQETNQKLANIDTKPPHIRVKNLCFWIKKAPIYTGSNKIAVGLKFTAKKYNIIETVGFLYKANSDNIKNKNDSWSDWPQIDERYQENGRNKYINAYFNL